MSNLSVADNSSSRSYFDRYLKQIEQKVLRMGALVEKSLRLSHQALFKQDLEVIEQINALDQQIDQYYRQIESDCTTLMTLQAPVSSDLRVISAFMQLVRDLERIGDYAQNLAEFSMKLFPYTPHPSLSEVANMSHQVQTMLAASLGALADLDATAGKRVNTMDDQVDQDFERLYNKLAKTENQSIVEPILLLGLAIQHLERMGDHAKNIGKRVAYIVNGDRS